jgi:hypothetical protein
MVAALVAALAAQRILAAADYTVLEQLPDRLHSTVADASDRTAGTPEKRLASQRRYNKLVLEMIHDVSHAYHGNRALSRQSIDTYAEQLNAVFRFRQRAVRPASPSTSDTELQIANDVHRQLLITVEHMVVAITQGDARFDYQQWKRRWDRAQLSDVP